MSALLQKNVQVVAPSANIIGAAETLMVYSGKVDLSLQTARLVIKAWLQITLAAGTTGLILRLRRGNGVTGALVAGGNTETAGLAAGKVCDLDLNFSEQLVNQDFADYSLTVQQAGAPANTLANIATIEVELLTS